MSNISLYGATCDRRRSELPNKKMERSLVVGTNSNDQRRLRRLFVRDSSLVLTAWQCTEVTLA